MFGHVDKLYMHKPEPVPETETHKILWHFEMKKRKKEKENHSIQTKGPDLVLINEKKQFWHLVNFGISANYRMKIKEGGKLDKYLNLARELKKVYNIKVTVIPIVNCALELGMRGRIETIQITALLKSTKILRRVLETWVNMLSLNFTCAENL